MQPEYQSDPERTAKIQTYQTKENVVDGFRASYFVRGEKFVDELEVYKIPRDELRLNWRNHRLSDKINELIEERKKAKYKIQIPDDFNVEDCRIADTTDPDDLGGDGYQIRELIKGNKIGDMAIDPGKQADYNGKPDALYNLMNKYKRKGGSGQRVAGVITPDGILINGNRRECVLDDFYKEAVEDKEDPKQYSYMYVGICPNEITNLDIMFMELFEQQSRESAEPFNRINYALTLREAYDGLALQQQKKLKGEGWDESIIATLTDKPSGVGSDEIIDHLNMHEFAKKILNRMKTFNGKKLTPEQDLSRISIDRPNESSSVIQIILDGSGKYFGTGKKKREMPAEKKVNHIKKIAAYIKGTWIDVTRVTEDKGSDEHVWNSDLGSNRGTNKEALWADDTKFDTDDYWTKLEKKYGWDNDEMFIEFGKDIEDEITNIKDQKLIREPKKHVDRVEKHVRNLLKKVTTGTKKAQNQTKKTLTGGKSIDTLKRTTKHLGQVVIALDPKTKNCPTCGHIIQSKKISKSTTRSTAANARKRRAAAAKKAAAARKRGAKKAAATRKRNQKRKR